MKYLIYNLKELRTTNIAISILLILFLTGCEVNNIEIHIWYGHEQHFGKKGHPQRWINILGSVDSEFSLKRLYYSLNGGKKTVLSIGQDERRLARSGDFNIDIHRRCFNSGKNSLTIYAVDEQDNKAQTVVEVYYHKGNTWPLPYSVKWKDISIIHDAVQVVDGKWELTKNGIKIAEPYYDRVLAFGDTTWVDFEVQTSIVFHSFTPPDQTRQPPTYGVSHAAIALRWPGHDYDNNQPHTKWHPLGATCEFTLSESLEECRWRMLKPAITIDKTSKRIIKLDKSYHMKARVQSVGDTAAMYSSKLWPAGEKEPEEWDLKGIDYNETEFYGSVLLIAHNTEVTFGDIKVRPVSSYE